MPIGSTAVLPFIIEEMIRVKPKKVLDIGIGNGMNGALIYNYATVLLPDPPVMIGIEPWEKYKNVMWDLYNDVFLDDLVKWVTHQKFDLIVMTDVIEHLDKEEGIKQLKRYTAMLNPGGTMIVSTPGIFVAQDAYDGNPYEIHKCLWTDQDFKDLKWRCIKPMNKSIVGEVMLMYRYDRSKKI